MGTKINPGEFDCYENAMPDEPMFVLLGRDPRSPGLVEDWAQKREIDIIRGSRPETDRDMVLEARECAVNMRLWRQANDGAWRLMTGGR